MTAYETRNSSPTRPSPNPPPNPNVLAVHNHLLLEETTPSHFLSLHKNEGWTRVFGGQLMAQALTAASRTVTEERTANSYHSTFLRPGRLDCPIEYTVAHIRDGRSFSTRRVAAIQEEKTLYELTATFQVTEAGRDYQNTMPDVSGPDESSRSEEIGRIYREHFPNHLPEPGTYKEVEDPAVETRLPDVEHFLKPTGKNDSSAMWIRFNDNLDLTPEHHKHLLAYTSDLGMGHITAQPHGLGGFNPDLSYVSLDHAMWFHRPFQIDKWMLLVRDCPTTTSGRGLIRGTFFTQSGDLAASFVQDGLFRMRA